MSDPVTIASLAKLKDGIDLVEMLSKLYHNYRNNKEKEWWEAVGRFYQGRSIGETREDIETRLHNLDSRERALKVILQSYRSLMDSIDDSVLPALAAITANYLSKDKQPDFFFRGICRMLGDMSHGEYVTLKEIVSDALQRIEQHSADNEITKIQWWLNTAHDVLRVQLISSDKTDENCRGVFENYERVMYLLYHNNLVERPTIFGGTAFMMHVPIMRNLNAFLK